MKTVVEKIRVLVGEREFVVAAIDGRSGAGKSTLADNLRVEFDGEIIRMDHFFLPLELRGEERLNVHHERFMEEVYPFIKERKPFSYRIFDCAKMDYSGVQKIEMKPLIIIEGAYSLLPQFDDIVDFRIFYDIDEETQKERIISRNGVERYQMFRDKWIPLEEAYFREYEVRERCDILLTPTPPFP